MSDADKPRSRLEHLKQKVAIKKKNGGVREGAGRKTKYKKEYCDLLIEHMREGYSYGTFASVIQVNPDTLYEWESKHKDWVMAKEQAKNAGLMTWETVGIASQQGKLKGSFSHWAIMGKNIYGANISFDSNSTPATSDGFVFVEGDSQNE